jgi:hypothetical protein
LISLTCDGSARLFIAFAAERIHDTAHWPGWSH